MKWLTVGIPFATRVTYLVFAVCTFWANSESGRIFKGEPHREGSTLYLPVQFCTGNLEITARGSTSSETDATHIDCIDLVWISVMIPVSNILSVTSVIGYSLVDVHLRYRRIQRWGTPFSSGLTAGLGFALLIILVESAFVCFAVGSVASYYESLYEGISYTAESTTSAGKLRLTGSTLGIYMAGSFACVAALLTIADASLLVSGHERLHHQRGGIATGVVVEPSAIASSQHEVPANANAPANANKASGRGSSSWISVRFTKSTKPVDSKAQPAKVHAALDGASAQADASPQRNAPVGNPFFADPENV